MCEQLEQESHRQNQMTHARKWNTMRPLGQETSHSERFKHYQYLLWFVTQNVSRRFGLIMKSTLTLSKPNWMNAVVHNEHGSESDCHLFSAISSARAGGLLASTVSEGDISSKTSVTGKALIAFISRPEVI